MTEVVLYHHAQGLTAGVRSFAERLRAAGHVVHTPDLFEGKTFSMLADGVAHAEELGPDTVIERGRLAADGFANEVVYAGLSMGVMPAQKLAQTKPGAKGALLIHSCVPLSFFGPWPHGVPLQIHTRGDDEYGDADVAREVAATVDGAELFLYPGDRHLFTDDSLPDYDAEASELVLQRVLAFLNAVG